MPSFTLNEWFVLVGMCSLIPVVVLHATIEFFGEKIITIVKKTQEEKEEKKRQEERNGRLLFAIGTIASAIEDYCIYLQDEILLMKYFGVVSSEIKSEKVALLNRFYGQHLSARAGIRSDLFNFVQRKVGGRVNDYQELFDQLLRMYAEQLQAVYDREEEMKKRHKQKFPPNSCSAMEIAANLEAEDVLLKENATCEHKFWRLHDTLKDLGLRTWGHRGYKIYIALKKVSPEEIPILN
ncbi:MAG: hypothetical protein ACD_56C00128G0002 [uncultured bacterium]|nr:MAG: hypothetical protein ACD_56C00128G0002 [uncultured bacterium]